MRVRFDTANSFRLILRLSQQESVLRFSHFWVFVGSTHKILLAESLVRGDFWIIKIVWRTAMPYCKIFIWFLLLFFIYFLFFYYLCSSFFGEQRMKMENRIAPELNRFHVNVVRNLPPFSTDCTTLHHLSFLSQLPIHLCAWCFESIPFNIN